MLSQPLHAAAPEELLAEIRASDDHRQHLVFKARPDITDAQYLEALSGTAVSGIFIDEGQEEGQGWGIRVFNHPVEKVWAAIVHEEAMDGKFSLGVSTILDERPFQNGRLIFQTLELPRPFSDRYWITRATHGAQAYTASGGALWEVAWQDVKDVSLKGTPYASYEEEGTPVEWTVGAWLLVPLSNGTTLVEYVCRRHRGDACRPLLRLGSHLDKCCRPWTECRSSSQKRARLPIQRGCVGRTVVS